jgi:acetyltransferase-like isoleucine patch superfamily enzyme
LGGTILRRRGVKMQEKVKNYREQLEEFLEGNIKGDQRTFCFEVDCALEKRIKFIYSVIFPGLKKMTFYYRFLIARIAYFIDYSPIKRFLYRRIGMNIGKGVFISPGVTLDPHFPSLISLEDFCILGWGSRIFTHEYSRNQYRIGSVKVGRGAVIGAFSTLRGGVNIGEMAEVPAMSRVFKDVPALSIKEESEK